VLDQFDPNIRPVLISDAAFMDALMGPMALRQRQ